MRPPNPGVVMPVVSTWLYGPRYGTTAQGGGIASATWTSANRAIYVPIFLPEAVLAVKVFWFNGTSVSGNVDCGIYNESFTRLVSSGSTAQSGTSALQEANITDTLIPAGRVYLALALDNTSGHIMRASQSTVWQKLIGTALEASAFPLPATATPATMTVAAYPFFGFSLRTLVA